LRQLCAASVRTQWDVLSKLVPTITQAYLLHRLESYLDQPCSSEYWGDEYTAVVAAWVIEQRIMVLQPSVVPLVYQTDIAPAQGCNECVIVYNGYDHYNSTCTTDNNMADPEALGEELDECSDSSSTHHESGGESTDDEIDEESGGGESAHIDKENVLDGCYVLIDHMEGPEESLDEAMEQCMSVLPVVMDPDDSPAFEAKRELAASFLASEYMRDHPTVPPEPILYDAAPGDDVAVPADTTSHAPPEATLAASQEHLQPWPGANDGVLFPQQHCAFERLNPGPLDSEIGELCRWHGLDRDNLPQTLELYELLKNTHRFTPNCPELPE
jgi:hypothetical protein